METSQASKSSQNVNKSCLSRKERWGFFIVNVGNIPIMTLMNVFLLYYYVAVVGLNPIAVGTLFLIARLFDGFNDPIMGYVVDHLPKTNLGRFRGYIIIGSIICGINYLILWLGPGLATAGKLTIAYISYLLFGFTFDLMDIPLNSMIPVMSDQDNDRNRLSNIKGLGYMFGAAIYYVLPIPFISLFRTEIQGFYALILLTVGIVICFSIFGALTIQERVQPIQAKKYTFQETVKILGTRPVLVQFLETLMNSIGGSINSALLIFFFIYVLMRVDLFVLIAIFFGIGVLIGILSMPQMVNHFGKKNTKIFANGISVVAFIMVLFVPSDQPFLFFFIVAISSIGGGINMLLNYGIQADNMDYVEWKLGFRAEGAVASINSFIIKAAQGVGSAIAAYALYLIKFDKSLHVQTELTIRGLYIITFALPSVFYLVGLLIWAFFYPINKATRNQMMAEIQRLHVAAEEKMPKMNEKEM